MRTGSRYYIAFVPDAIEPKPSLVTWKTKIHSLSRRDGRDQKRDEMRSKVEDEIVIEIIYAPSTGCVCRQGIRLLFPTLGEIGSKVMFVIEKALFAGT